MLSFLVEFGLFDCLKRAAMHNILYGCVTLLKVTGGPYKRRGGSFFRPDILHESLEFLVTTDELGRRHDQTVDVLIL